MATDEEEVVRALWYLGKVGVTDPRGVETKDVTEDLWRYVCDIQQRVSGPFESDNFRIQGQDGVEVDLAAHPGGLNTLRKVSHALCNGPTHIGSYGRFFFEQQAAHRSAEESWRLDVGHCRATRRVITHNRSVTHCLIQPAC